MGNQAESRFWKLSWKMQDVISVLKNFLVASLKQDKCTLGIKERGSNKKKIMNKARGFVYGAMRKVP